MENNTQIFDYERLRESVMKDDELLQKLVTKFFMELDTKYDLLLRYVQTADFEGVKTITHKIKSSALTLHMYVLASMLSAMNDSAQEYDVSKCIRYMYDIEKHIRILREEVEKYTEIKNGNG